MYGSVTHLAPGTAGFKRMDLPSPQIFIVIFILEITRQGKKLSGILYLIRVFISSTPFINCKVFGIHLYFLASFVPLRMYIRKISITYIRCIPFKAVFVGQMIDTLIFRPLFIIPILNPFRQF